MASTILYKFRSGTTFEALPMPGTSARLFDVKKAIVKAKKLDRSTVGPQLEFDLSVRNATTNEEYVDDAMLLPRGTRVVVQRLPAAKGHGLLARISRAETGHHNIMTMNNPANVVQYGNVAAAKSGFYEIHSREEEEEFEDAAADEMAALKAVTDQASHIYTNRQASSSSVVRTATSTIAPTPSSLPPRTHNTGGGYKAQQPSLHVMKPNADPELAKQERLLQQQQQPTKKRPTGIPRTFLNSTSNNSTSSQTNTNNNNNNSTEESSSSMAEDGSSALSRLQPNTIGFQALVNRGGGQSETTRDLEYALKLTSTTIPEHLQCGICHSVVKKAMLIPWDMEGRTTCERCIRDGLTQSGFVCPLTQQVGVSPDDLLPNHGLRKAAELFVSEVMKQMDLLLQQEKEQQQQQEAAAAAAQEQESSILEEEHSSILNKKSILTNTNNTRTKSDDLLEQDEFGGDVFDVATEEKEEEPPKEEEEQQQQQPIHVHPEPKQVEVKSSGTVVENPTSETVVPVEPEKDDDNHEDVSDKDSIKNNDESKQQTKKSIPTNKFDSVKHFNTRLPKQQQQQQQQQSRGPPQGYVIGPAVVGNVNTTTDTNNNNQNSMQKPRGGGFHRGGGRNYMNDGRGRGGRGSNRARGGRGSSRSYTDQQQLQQQQQQQQQGKNDGRNNYHRSGGRGFTNNNQQSQHSNNNNNEITNNRGWSQQQQLQQQQYDQSKSNNQWDGPKQHHSHVNDHTDHSANTKKRSRSESIDVNGGSNNRERQSKRPYNNNSNNNSNSSRNNYRGSNNNNHQDHNRGGDGGYRRPHNNNNNLNDATNFSYTSRGGGGRGSGQDRYRNQNYRGRGRNYGGYREGNDYSRGRY